MPLEKGHYVCIKRKDGTKASPKHARDCAEAIKWANEAVNMRGAKEAHVFNVLGYDEDNHEIAEVVFSHVKPKGRK